MFWISASLSPAPRRAPHLPSDLSRRIQITGQTAAAPGQLPSQQNHHRAVKYMIKKLLQKFRYTLDIRMHLLDIADDGRKQSARLCFTKNADELAQDGVTNRPADR